MASKYLIYHHQNTKQLYFVSVSSYLNVAKYLQFLNFLNFGDGEKRLVGLRQAVAAGKNEIGNFQSHSQSHLTLDTIRNFSYQT